MSRNIRCPRYSACLDAAVDLGVSDWSCAGCCHIKEIDGIDPAEIDGCVLLLWRVFKPELYDEAIKRLQSKP